MDPTRDTHAKLLARDFLRLAAARGAVPRAESVGVVVSRERQSSSLRFLLDDGTGCIPCVLWLNRRQPEILAAAAEEFAALARLGALVRVRGRVGRFRGAAELAVGNVVAERDPNAEALHWLQCIRLARRGHGSAASAETRKRKAPMD